MFHQRGKAKGPQTDSDLGTSNSMQLMRFADRNKTKPVAFEG